MNYITLAIVGLTVMPIVFGALLGLLRGSRRALLRLILVVVSIALAFALTGAVTKSLMNIEIGFLGGTLVDFLQNNVLGNLPSALAEYTIPLAQSILQVVVFLLLFFVLWLLTWAIVFPICQIFVKPKRVKDASGRVVSTKKRRLIGLAIGAAQGVVVAVIVCIVFTGLLTQTNKIITVAGELTDTIGEMGVEANANGDVMALSDVDYDADEDYSYPDGGEQSADATLEMITQYTDMIAKYVDSPLGKMYNGLGAKPFDWITTVKVNDTKVTFASQVDTLCTIVSDVSKLAKEYANLQNFDFSKLLEEGNIEDLQALFDSLGDVMDELSGETKKVIDELITSLAEQGGVDLGDMKFTDIDFHKEGQIVADMFEYTQKDELKAEDANDIIDLLTESDLVINIVSSQGLDVSSKLEEHELEVVSNRIDELAQGGTVSQEKIDALRSIFGLNKNPEPEVE